MRSRLLSIFGRGGKLSKDDLHEARLLGKFVADSICAVFDLAGCEASTFPLERGEAIGVYIIGYCDVISQCLGNDVNSDISVEACRAAFNQIFGIERGRGLMRMIEVGSPDGAKAVWVEAGRTDALDGFTKKVPPFGLMGLILDEYQSSCSSPDALRGIKDKWIKAMES